MEKVDWRFQPNFSFNQKPSDKWKNERMYWKDFQTI